MKRDRAQDFPAELIDANEAIDLVVDAVLVGNASVRRLTKQIVKHQRRLRRAVDDDAWRTYLRLEEVENARAERLMQILVRWALAHRRVRVVNVVEQVEAGNSIVPIARVLRGAAHQAPYIFVFRGSPSVAACGFGLRGARAAKKSTSAPQSPPGRSDRSV